MIAVGSTVKATITKIEPYGLYLEHDGERILVERVFLSWPGEEINYDEFHLGEMLDVVILDYMSEKQLYVGSRKHLRPEANPYLALAARSPTDPLCGRVRIVHKNGLSIEVGNGCFGNLPYEYRSSTLAVGDEVLVAVESIDPQRQFLKLRFLRRKQPT